MPKAYTSTVIDLPADRVWAAVRDFNGLATWRPAAVTDSEIEEGKAGDQVGAVRSFHLRDGAHLRERLLSHSATSSGPTRTISRRRRSTCRTTTPRCG